jgi:hypothetical protein
MKPLRWLTVSMTRESAEASTGLSPTGCTRRRAVSVPIGLKATVLTTHATAEAPTVLSLIGCTRLRAVSGILRTQRGRRGSRAWGSLRALPPTARAGAAGRALLLHRAISSPCGPSPPLAPVARLWPASGVAHLPQAPGVQPGCVPACQIAGPYHHCRPRRVQWGGLGLALPGVDRRLHRDSRGPGDGRSRPSVVRG